MSLCSTSLLVAKLVTYDLDLLSWTAIVTSIINEWDNAKYVAGSIPSYITLYTYCSLILKCDKSLILMNHYPSENANCHCTSGIYSATKYSGNRQKWTINIWLELKFN